MSKNLIIGQSGGPTAVINSSLAGAIDYALGCDEIGRRLRNDKRNRGLS